jgi:hypothetical protein
MSHPTPTPVPDPADRGGLADLVAAPRSLATLAGAAALALCIVLMLVPPARALIYPAYLVGYVFWFGIALGGLSLTMLHHLTGGTWGLLIRRPLEAAAQALVPLAILFVPILFGLDVLYPWARSADAAEPLIAHKASYLNPTAFTLRAAAYFGLWILLAWLMNRGTDRQDRAADRAPSRTLARIAAPGLGLVFLTATFAAIDWMMSLEPDWYSSIYGAMLITGWGLATLAAMTIVASALRRQPEMQPVARPRVFQDLASLMLAFVMLWAYTSFMQYLIIWSGNLTEEIPWYLRRSRGGWQVFVSVLILFHFLAPFLLLLMRDLKRRAEWLLGFSAAILGLHLIDMTWLILPAQVRDPLSPAVGVPILQLLLVILATIGIGGICVGFFLDRLARRPLVPLNDPAVDGLAHLRDDEADDADEPYPTPAASPGA